MIFLFFSAISIYDVVEFENLKIFSMLSWAKFHWLALAFYRFFFWILKRHFQIEWKLKESRVEDNNNNNNNSEARRCRAIEKLWIWMLPLSLMFLALAVELARTARSLGCLLGCFNFSLVVDSLEFIALQQQRTTISMLVSFFFRLSLSISLPLSFLCFTFFSRLCYELLFLFSPPHQQHHHHHCRRLLSKRAIS